MIKKKGLNIDKIIEIDEQVIPILEQEINTINKIHHYIITNHIIDKNKNIDMKNIIIRIVNKTNHVYQYYRLCKNISNNDKKYYFANMMNYTFIQFDKQNIINIINLLLTIVNDHIIKNEMI